MFRRSNTVKNINFNFDLKSQNSSVSITKKKENKLLKLLFDQLVKKKREYLTPNDLRNIFEKINIFPNRNEIFSILCDYDTTETGCFTFEEFLSMVTNKIQPYQNDTNNDYLKVFKKIDYLNQGFINKQTLLEGFTKFGVKIKKEDLDNIFFKLGKNKMDFNDFKKIIFDYIQKWNNDNNFLKNFK